MPKVKLPINSIPYKNIDSISNERLGVDLIDGLIDDSESLVRRPALELKLDLNTGSPVDGLYWWDKKRLLMAVSWGDLFKIENNLTTVTNITGDKFNVGTKVIFTDNGEFLFAANGGRIIFTDGTANTAFIPDPDAPGGVTHVAFIDSFILANSSSTDKFFFSAVLDPFDWNALNFVASESLPDNINALFTNYREIGVFGRESFDVFKNDGVNPFSRLDGAFIERGTLAPYSIQEVDNSYYWIDDKKRVIRTQRRTADSFSRPFDKVIQNIDTVSDANGMFMTPEGWGLYVLQFPTEGRTYVFDAIHGYWSEWTRYIEFTNSRDRWLGNCYAIEKDANKHMVGSRIDGKLYNLTFEKEEDESELIKTVKLTGHIDHGTSNKKSSREVTFKIKRGEGAPGTSPKLMIRWKDDGNIGFGTLVSVPLLDINNENFFYSLKPMGIYNSRQYEISITDTVELVLVYAEEDFEVLDDG